MPLDQETSALLSYMAQSPSPPLHTLSPAVVREAAAAADVRVTEPAMLRVEDRRIATSDGSTIAIRVLTPTEAPSSVMVYLHGGGWMVGTLDGHEGVARQLAARNNATVVLVDYRLAPEFPYPIPGRDAWDAVRWTAVHLSELAGGSVPLVVAGDSAGATLATVCARRARDEGGPEVAAQVLMYPATDYDLSRASYMNGENHLLLDPDGMEWFWGHYVPDAARRTEPDAAPIRAEDLTGMPPTVLGTAEYDVLRDEGEAYGERLRSAGNEIDQHRFEGQTHGFFTMVGVLPGSDTALGWITERLQARLDAPAEQPA